MKGLKVIPEIFIWLAFSVVAGFGYAFSFYGYLDRHSVISASNIFIPTLVWLLLALICTLLFRLAQSTERFTRFSAKESAFLECSIFLLLLVGGWVFRFVEYFNGAWPAEIDTTYFLYAEVSQNSIEYLNPHPVSRMYVGLLHVVFLFFGNQYTFGVYLQFVLLLIGVLLWYFALRMVFGKVTALIFTAGAMLLPDSIASSMQCNPMMLLFFIYGLVAWQLVAYAKGKNTGFVRYLQVFLLGVYTMFCFLLDISGVMILAAYLLALSYRDREDSVKKEKTFFLSFLEIVSILAAAWGFRFVQGEMYHISFAEAGRFHAYHGLAIPWIDLEHIKGFVFDLGTQPVFLVAIVVISVYWFIPKRSIMTWMIIGELFLLAIRFLKLDFYLSHQFLIGMGLALMLGIAAEQFLEASRVKREKPALTEMDRRHREEPSVTVVRFEDRPAVTVPEKGAVDLHMEDTIELPKIEEIHIEEIRFEGTIANQDEVSKERPLIFIPKSMEIPKRVSKPKLDYTIEVEEEKLHYDFAVAENADFDI